MSKLSKAFKRNPVQTSINIVAPGNVGGLVPGKGSGSGSGNTASGPTDHYLQKFKDTPYYDDPTFQNIVANYAAMGNKYNVDNSQPTYDQVSGYANTFQSMFKNKVGRDPNAEELSTFFKSLAADNPWSKEANAYGGLFGDKAKGLISDVFSGVAEQEATNKAKRLSDEAVAPGSAFDTWSNEYRGSLTGVEKSLQDFQARLFEKLRPQLLTSLQSQGLLNSGGLNEAFAGAAKDLTEGASDYMLQARSAVDQDIANERYKIKSSPTNYELDNTYNRVPNIMASGQQSLNNVFKGYMQDQAFNNNMRLLERQQPERTSPLAQYGGLILGGVAAGYGQGLGNRLGRRTM